MSRSFLVGLLWGLVVCAAGLAVVSQLAPIGGPDRVTVLDGAETGDAPQRAVPGADQVPEAKAEPATTASGQVDLTAAPSQPGADAPATKDQPVGADPAAPLADPAAAATPAPAPAPDPAAAKAPGSDAKPAEPLAQPGDLVPAQTETGAAAPGSETAPAVPGDQPLAPSAPTADAAPLPDAGTMPAPRQDKLLDPPRAPQSPGVEPAPALPATEAAQQVPKAVTLPVPSAPEAATPPDSQGAGLVELGQARLPSAPRLKDEAAGVTTDRLPRIGDPPATGAVAADPALPDARPIVAFARPYAPEADKPLFAILLQDIGAAGMARADLAKLPFAVTFVVDPAAPDAAAAMAAYRAAGQEVVIRALLPANATPVDLEQSFQALALSLPETVALLDTPEGGLQENRVLATQAIPILKAQGRGIVTFDRGLGAADQVARREGLATAMIFRDLDAQGEDTPLIRRYLDRAAFKAAQEGRVVVIGQTRPETVAAILEWLVEGRGATVSLAPLTAVMQGGS